MHDNIENINDTVNKKDLLKLDNQLCFSLYVCSKEIIKKYKPLLDPLGLTYTSYITLLALWEEDNINVKDLGKKLYLDSGTLTPILKKLEAANLLTRTRCVTDERNVNISLTKEGMELKEKALSVPNELICSIFKDNENFSSGIDLLNSLHRLMETF
jgi:DNA-binding MarR family transcriptional regulator